MTHKERAVTIIELLCIVAIVALLAAIAIPNFYEAKTSSMVAQAKEDMRTISVGLEAYKVDLGEYPRMHPYRSCLVPPSLYGTARYQATLDRLTTPVSYLSGSTPFWDPFDAVYEWYGTGFTYLRPADTPVRVYSFKQYYYFARNEMEFSIWDVDTSATKWFLLESAGPDRRHHDLTFALNFTGVQISRIVTLTRTLYDPTNGTISRGSIWQYGGTPEGRGSAFTDLISNANSSRIHDWRSTEP